jgi:hypothetical protein
MKKEQKEYASMQFHAQVIPVEEKEEESWEGYGIMTGTVSLVRGKYWENHKGQRNLWVVQSVPFFIYLYSLLLHPLYINFRALEKCPLLTLTNKHILLI